MSSKLSPLRPSLWLLMRAEYVWHGFQGYVGVVRLASRWQGTQVQQPKMQACQCSAGGRS